MIKCLTDSSDQTIERSDPVGEVSINKTIF